MTSRGLLVGVGLLSTVVAACQPTTYSTPSLAGVVTDLTLAPGSSTVRDYELEGGQTIHVDLETYQDTGGDLPVVGDLLLAGNDPVHWIARVPPIDLQDRPHPCYFLQGTGRLLDDAIEFDVIGKLHPLHLRLPKVAGFDFIGGSSTPGSKLEGHDLCLDAHGRATVYG